MRIPFSSLRFEPDANGDVRMGLIVWRYVARNSEFDVFPEIPNNWRNSAYKPSQASPIVFRGIEPRRPLYLKPYVLGGMSQRNLLAETGDSYTGVSSWTSELGGDLKYNVTSNLVLDLTVNTDFAQVEADDQIVNLERFSLFFPEKRDFFQERSDLFEFSVPGRMNESLFHSRTIGIVDGQPIPIHGGARLTGCYRDWDVGLLNMQTAAATVNGRTVAAENFGVLRLRRPVGDRGSYVGGMLTSRTDLRSAYNLVYALDADLHIVDDYFVDMKVAQSVEPDVDPLAGIMAAMFFQRRINRGFFVGTSYRYVGPDFNPAVGFMPRTGYNRVGNRIAYTWVSLYGKLHPEPQPGPPRSGALGPPPRAAADTCPKRGLELRLQEQLIGKRAGEFHRGRGGPAVRGGKRGDPAGALPVRGWRGQLRLPIRTSAPGGRRAQGGRLLRG